MNEAFHERMEDAIVEEKEQEEEEESIDYINHLPDDILFSIFSRLKDAKWLMCCYMVSRRFAHVVSHVKITHFTISHCNFDPPREQGLEMVPPPNFRGRVLNALSKPLNYLHFSFSRLCQRVLAPPPPPSLGLSFHDAGRFLQTFREVENLFIYIPRVDKDDHAPVIKWEAVLSREWDYFVVLIASKVRELDPSEDEAIDMQTLRLTNPLFKSRLKLSAECFRAAMWRHHTSRHIVGNQRQVQAILFTDTKSEGTLYIYRSQVRDLVHVDPNLTSDLHESKEKELRSRIVKLWYVPLLNLPICRRTIEGASLVLISLSNNPIEEDILRLAFREDEIFSEAAREICQNYGSNGFALTANMKVDHFQGVLFSNAGRSNLCHHRTRHA